MLLSDEDLFTIGEGVWTSIAEGFFEQAAPEDAKFEGNVVSAFVQITGDWEGVVSIRCSRALSEAIASSMFALEPNELSNEEIYDAVGEIANMIGGGVKSIAEGESTLTIPVVAEGNENVATVPGTTTENTVVAKVGNEPMVLQVSTRASVAS